MVASSGVRRNLFWGAVGHLCLKGSLNFNFVCEFKAQTHFYLVHNVIVEVLWRCKCPIAPPLATLLVVSSSLTVLTLILEINVSTSKPHE